MKTMMKKDQILSIINNSLVDLPTPVNITSMWSIGSMLGIMLTTQIITGIFLTMHYSPDPSIAFQAIINIHYNVNNGWLIKTIHANGASMFFILMFSHTMRNIYFNSFFLKMTWTSGVTLLLISIITAFLGYVLPWGQMSFWGATVITNLVSAIPYLGQSLVEWLWGGFSVDKPTLTRFYSFHFLFPFIILVLVILHLMFLHETGSSNPLGIKASSMKIPFHPFFSSKDLIGFNILFMGIVLVSLISPNILMDPENFMIANPMVTPIHIQPEWYFLFAYTILRSVPNKLGGVIGLVLAIAILYTFPIISNTSWQSFSFNPIKIILFWNLILILIILTWLGMKAVSYPFDALSKMTAIVYFYIMILLPFKS